MKPEYDFSDAKRNPYSKLLNEEITLSLPHKTIDYFKRKSEDKGVPYEALITLYLRNCASNNIDLEIS